jgi:rubrerythrin
MPELKGSKTMENLAYAFAGESMARNKYTFFSSAAKKEGYEQISAIFADTAANEKEHAELWYKHMNGGIGNTMENLAIAAAGEHEEWTQMYKDFAEVARQEGFTRIAEQMEGAAAIEKSHEERYLALLENLKNGRVFQRETEQVWFCRNCGHIHTGTEAPESCPVCEHPRAYFELRKVNY